MGGWKNLIINGWVRHNGGADLKMGGGSFPKEFWCHKIYLTKLPPFDPMLQKYSASAFQNCHGRTGARYIFFYISMLVVSVVIALCGVFIFWVSNCLKIGQVGQKPYWISFFFFALNYKQL